MDISSVKAKSELLIMTKQLQKAFSQLPQKFPTLFAGQGTSFPVFVESVSNGHYNHWDANPKNRGRFYSSGLIPPCSRFAVEGGLPTRAEGYYGNGYIAVRLGGCAFDTDKRIKLDFIANKMSSVGFDVAVKEYCLEPFLMVKADDEKFSPKLDAFSKIEGPKEIRPYTPEVWAKVAWRMERENALSAQGPSVREGANSRKRLVKDKKEKTLVPLN